MNPGQGVVYLLAFALAGLLATTQAVALESATVQYTVVTRKNTIDGLTWNTPERRLNLRSESDQILALISGTYLAKGWALLLDGQEVTIGEDGLFQLVIPLKGLTNEVKFVAVGPTGEVKENSIVIKVSSWEMLRRDVTAQQRGGFLWTLGLKGSLLNHTETRNGSAKDPYVGTLLNCNAAVISKLPLNNWKAEISWHFTMMPLFVGSNDSVRLVGVDAGVGYTLPPFSPSWSISLWAGLHYASMMVNTEYLGLRNLRSPRIYPVVIRTFAEGDSFTTYLKFAPVGESFTALSFANKEFALGGLYRFAGDMKKWTLTLDISSLQFDSPELEMSSTSSSLGIGISF